MSGINNNNNTQYHTQFYMENTILVERVWPLVWFKQPICIYCFCHAFILINWDLLLRYTKSLFTLFSHYRFIANFICRDFMFCFIVSLRTWNMLSQVIWPTITSISTLQLISSLTCNLNGFIIVLPALVLLKMMTFSNLLIIITLKNIDIHF